MSNERDAFTLAGLCSMATRHLLAELTVPAVDAGAGGIAGVPVRFEAMGGADAARRVAAGEPFDVVVLAEDVLRRLAVQGQVRADSIRPFALSVAALAVPGGATRPSLRTQDEFFSVLLAARGIGYSTGPSGVQLLATLERAGLLGRLGGRMVQAPPGKPVAELIREGVVDVGVQQLPELAGCEGVDVVGPLPPGVAIETVFAAAVGASAAEPLAARRFIDRLAASEAHAAIRRARFEPVAAI